MPAELPTRASVVVVGGGVMGLSIAYNLARGGVENVLVIERDALGSGSTSKAAGGVRAQFSDEVNIRLGQRSLEILETFAADFGQEIDLHRSGYLFLVDDEETLERFAQDVAVQNSYGVPSRILTPAEAGELNPFIRTDHLRGAAFGPTDGHCTPEGVVAGYAKAARALGVRIVTGCEVTAIETAGEAISGVRTSHGDVDTSAVVCAAGAWSKSIGDMAGVDLPVVPLGRQIVVTSAMPGLPPGLPFTIDFASSFYFHRESGGLLLGMPDASDAWGFDQTPSKAWIERLAETIADLAPGLGEIGIGKGWRGLYEMTPDHNAIIGEASGTSRFLYATGFSGHGFLMGPAVGEVVADLYLGNTPTIDVSALSVDRFAQATTRVELTIV